MIKLSRVQFTNPVHFGVVTESRLSAEREGRVLWELTLEPADKEHGERIRVLLVGARPECADYVPIDQVLTYRVAAGAKR